jgi:hypothetical protein
MAQNSYERFLGDVFGHTGVADNTQGQSEESSLITSNESEDRAVVANGHAREKRLIGGLVVVTTARSHQQIVRLGRQLRSFHEQFQTPRPDELWIVKDEE